MKKTLPLLVLCLFVSCNKQSYNKITIANNDTIKTVQLEIVSIDTFKYNVPVTTSDSIILKEAQLLSDSIKLDRARRDSLHIINFRKITKIINGGYNGYADREQLWTRAKDVLNEK